ncbi:MAG: KR domain-containing protein, partial [Planctomycetota bacterium]
MAAKVLGTRVLETLFESRELDFLVLCSSLTSVLGGVGQVDYCAANAFLDAFAHQNDMRRRTRSEGPQCTVAIDWDTWSETGMTVETEVPADLRETRARRLRTGLSNAEGCESFHRILAAEQPQVLVSTRSLDDVRREVESESAGDTEACGVTSAVAARATHARPALATEFVAPRNEGERAVAEIWEDLFGLTGVGVRDSFLELGGHSLLAVQLVNRLNRAFGTRLTLRALFEDPTVAALAERIDAAADRGARPADSIRAPLAVDELSDREVASMLRRMLDEDPYSDEETLRAD